MIIMMKLGSPAEDWRTNAHILSRVYVARSSVQELFMKLFEDSDDT